MRMDFFPVINGLCLWYVHKLHKHKEIGAWHRRGPVYQPVTGKR